MASGPGGSSPPTPNLAPPTGGTPPPELPIDSNIIILVTLGLILGIYVIWKSKKRVLAIGEAWH